MIFFILYFFLLFILFLSLDYITIHVKCHLCLCSMIFFLSLDHAVIHAKHPLNSFNMYFCAYSCSLLIISILSSSYCIESFIVQIIVLFFYFLHSYRYYKINYPLSYPLKIKRLYTTSYCKLNKSNSYYLSNN